jgi:hypothetical protein
VYAYFLINGVLDAKCFLKMMIFEKMYALVGKGASKAMSF